MSAASVTPAVKVAATQARLKILTMAAGDSQSPVHGATPEELDFKDGKVFRKASPDKSISFTEIWRGKEIDLSKPRETLNQSRMQRSFPLIPSEPYLPKFPSIRSSVRFESGV